MNEITQIVTMEVSLRLHWFDKRIAMNNATLESLAEDQDFLTLNPRIARHIWVPDIFIDQAKDLREPTFHVLPASLRIYRFGRTFRRVFSYNVHGMGYILVCYKGSNKKRYKTLYSHIVRSKKLRKSRIQEMLLKN